MININGDIYSLVRHRLILPAKHFDGYLQIRLGKRNSRKSFLLHRLIAKHFIPNPENKPQVNHINSDRADNRIENLEWCTISENVQHAYDNNRCEEKIRQMSFRHRKINKSDYEEIRRLRPFYTLKAIADKYGLHESTVGRICKGKELLYA